MLLLLLALAINSVLGLYAPQGDDDIMWLVPETDAVQVEETVPLHIRSWPSSPPSHPIKRYPPYHPVARFKGIGIDSNPLVYPFEIFIESPLFGTERLKKKKKLTMADLISVLGGLLYDVENHGKYSGAIRFGISRR